MKVFETKQFLKRAKKLFSEEERRSMENEVAANPSAHPIIQGTGGLRKARVTLPGRGKGKRGGARIIYYHWANEQLIIFIFVYAKNDQEDLTAQQRKDLAGYIDQFKEAYDGKEDEEDSVCSRPGEEPSRGSGLGEGGD